MRGLEGYPARVQVLAAQIREKSIEPHEIAEAERDAVQEFLMMEWLRRKLDYVHLPLWAIEGPKE